MTGIRKRVDWRRALKGTMMRYAPGMLSCSEFENALQAQPDNVGGLVRRWKIRLHLRLCRECRDYFEAYGRTIEVVKALHAKSRPDLPEKNQSKIVAAILKQRNQ